MADKQNFVRAKNDQVYNEDNHGIDLHLEAKKWTPITKETVKLLKEKFSYLEFKVE